MCAELKAHVLSVLDAVVAELSDVPTEGSRWKEVHGGWTEPVKARWLIEFARMKEHVASGDLESLWYHADHLVRELDHDSVVGGPVLALSAELQSALCDFVRSASG